MRKNQDEISNTKTSNHYLLKLDSRGKYYNDRLNVVRCIYRDKYFDFRLSRNEIEVPNPKFHSLYVVVNDSVLEGFGLTEEEQFYFPGIKDDKGNTSDLPYAMAFLVNVTKKSDTADPQTGGASFSINNTNMFDQDNIRISISPPLNIDYTSTEDKNKNLGTSNIGIFINDDTILIKSKGGSITIGEEGIYLGGKVFKESAVEENGIFTDNTIADMMGSTIPTFIAAFPKLPNVGQFYAFAEVAQRVIEIAKVAENATTLIG